MRHRRGGRRYPSEEEKLVDLYEPGDIVCNLLHGDSSVFKGVVVKSDTATRKVWVKWGAGELQQHSPDEIILYLRRLDESEYQQFSEHAMNDFSKKFRRSHVSNKVSSSRRKVGENNFDSVVSKIANDFEFLSNLKEAGALEPTEVEKVDDEKLEKILVKYEEDIVPAKKSIKELANLIKNIPALKPEYKIFTNTLKVLDKTELKDLSEDEK